MPLFGKSSKPRRKVHRKKTLTTTKKRRSSSLKHRKRTQKSNRLSALRSFFLVVSFVALVAGYLIYKTVFSQSASADGKEAMETSILPNQDFYSILVASLGSDSTIDDLHIYLTQKNDKKLYILNIPTDSIVDVPGRFGEEKLSNLFKLQKTTENNQSASEDLLIQSVQKLLGLEIDRYLVAGSQNLKAVISEPGAKPEVSLKSTFKARQLIKDSYTNLTNKELFEFASFAKALKPGSVESTDVAFISDSVAVDKLISAFLLNTSISKLNKTASVLNGTAQPLIAGKVARIPSNVGARVVSVENAVNLYEKSYLVTSDPTSPEVVYLQSYFPHMGIITPDKAESLGELDLDRADLTIIIGFDTVPLL